jgi:hypothetical protein
VKLDTHTYPDETLDEYGRKIALKYGKELLAALHMKADSDLVESYATAVNAGFGLVDEDVKDSSVHRSILDELGREICAAVYKRLDEGNPVRESLIALACALIAGTALLIEPTVA